MSWQRPSPAEVWKAVETYLRVAYEREPPSAVRARLDTLRAAPEADFYDSAVLEPEPKLDPTRYSLRLGNRFYPHMKLAIEQAPDGQGYLFHANTHDQHCCPAPQSRDYAPFCQLMEANQKMAQTIETQWEAQRLPTFKTFLKADLARRKAAGNGQ